MALKYYCHKCHREFKPEDMYIGGGSFCSRCRDKMNDEIMAAKKMYDGDPNRFGKVRRSFDGTLPIHTTIHCDDCGCRIPDDGKSICKSCLAKRIKRIDEEEREEKKREKQRAKDERRARRKLGL